jgi:hypothetical protein
MEIEAVGSTPVAVRPPQPTGVSAELAEARSKLRDATPPGRWDLVLAEVSRLQTEQRMPPLEAMREVLRRLASGWVPPAR